MNTSRTRRFSKMVTGKKYQKRPLFSRKKAYVKKSYGRNASKKKKTARTKASRTRKLAILSTCTQAYLQAQYNPWATFVKPPCVPDFMAMPSYKFSTKIRGTMVSQANGIAFIAMNPYLINKGPVVGGTNPDYVAPLMYSDGTGTRTGYSSYNNRDPANVGGLDPGTKGAYWDSPYSAGEVSNALLNEGNLDWRPVGGGVKIRYAGNVMEREGTITLYEDPNNSTFMYDVGNFLPAPPNNVVEQTAIIQKSEAAFQALGDGEYAVLYHPRNLSDLDYSSHWQNDLGALAKYDVMYIIINGLGATSQAFTFEAIMHWEANGSSVPSRTRTEADPNGLAAVQSSLGTKPSLANPSLQHAMKKGEVAQNLGQESGARIFTASGYIR